MALRQLKAENILASGKRLGPADISPKLRDGRSATQGRPDWESGRPAGREWRRVWAAGYPGSMRSRIAIAQRCWHPLEHRPVRPGGVLTERSGPPGTNAGQLSQS